MPTTKDDNKKAFWIFTAMVWLIAILFGWYERMGTGLQLDYAILDWVHASSAPMINKVMAIFTFTGDPIFYVYIGIPILAFLLWKKKYKEALCLLAALLLGTLINTSFKYLFQRVRPVGYALIEQGGLSYPSGHSFVGASFYPTLGALMAYNNTKWKPLAVLLTIYGFLPGISRIFLGVHYPTDVFFGLLLGFTFGRSCFLFYKKKKEEEHKRIAA